MIHDKLNKLGWLAVALILAYVLVKKFAFVHQTTASMPEGWYVKYPRLRVLHHGDVVLFYPKQRIDRLMIKRGWIHWREPMMKKVYALAGDDVCVRQQQLWINHRRVAPISEHDEYGRPLPQWHFCGRVAKGDVLLMSTRVSNSLDGRYFGLLKTSRVYALVKKI